MLISELNHAASVSAAYASSRALPHAHARLASGWWLAFAGRASTLWTPMKGFYLLHQISSFPRFILARRIFSPDPNEE